MGCLTAGKFVYLRLGRGGPLRTGRHPKTCVGPFLPRDTTEGESVAASQSRGRGRDPLVGCPAQGTAGCRSVSVLVVEDDPIQRDVLSGFLEVHPVFSVTAVGTQSDAMARLRASWSHSAGEDMRCRVCVMDLHLPDNHSDRLRLLTVFRNVVTFVIVSGTDDVEQAYLAGLAGAFAVKSKAGLSASALQKTVFRAFLASILYPRYSPGDAEPIHRVAGLLLERVFSSVGAWAYACGLTDSAHRKLWRRHAELERREALRLRQAFGACFASCPCLDRRRLAQGPTGHHCPGTTRST